MSDWAGTRCEGRAEAVTEAERICHAHHRDPTVEVLHEDGCPVKPGIELDGCTCRPVVRLKSCGCHQNPWVVRTS